MELAFLLPTLCAAAFALDVLIARQLGVPWKHRVAAGAALAAAGAAFLLFLYVLGDLFLSRQHAPEELRLVGPGAQVFEFPWFAIDRYSFPVTYVVDWLSVMMLGVVSGLSFLIQFYSLGYMRGDNRFWWFFSAMSLFTASMLGLVLSYNLLILYMFWELVGLCSFLLIGFWYDRRSAAEAAKKAFITTRIGDVGFFIGMLIFFSQVRSFDLGEVFHAVESGAMDSTLATVATLLIFLGAMGKSGQFPLHVWLPDAMEGPTPVSALIHAATMVAAGVYLVARLFPLFHHSPLAMAVVATIGTFTAIFAATIALVQRDIKRIMAYSTVSQLGYMMMALGVGAWTAGVFHLYTHAFFKALLFLCAGSVIHAVNTNDIFQMGGLRRYQPITFVTCVIAALALAGIPPLAGFWSKDEILAGSLLNGAWLAYLVGLVTAFLTAFYMFRAIILTFLGQPRWAVDEAQDEQAAHAAHGEEHGPAHRVHESPWTMWVPLVLIAGLTTVAGLVNVPHLLSAFGEVLHAPVEMLEAHPDATTTILLSVIAVVVSLLGIGLAFAVYHAQVLPAEVLSRQFAPVYRTLAHKYYFDELYQWLVDRVVLVISAFVALFDRKIVNNAGVDGTARYGILEPGRQLRYHSTGRVYNYAFAFVVGIAAVLLVMLYWPEIDIRLW